jgi:hypothetical protein
VIALRTALERGLGNRWLRIALLLLLAVLLVLMVIHGTHDQAAEAGVICLALVMLLVCIVIVPRVPVRIVFAPLVQARPPPVPAGQSPALATIASPLRR